MLSVALAVGLLSSQADSRPNILFCIADDWGWPHAGAYGEPVVLTPNFDRVAREGVLFQHAFVSSPSCTPSRSAILTGQDFWRLREAANLWSTLSTDFTVYPDLLEDAGYHVGHWRKAWGPGRLAPGGRKRNPAGPTYKSFDAFLDERDGDEPFCFWLGASDPHRGYAAGSGEESGMDLSEIRVPGCFPDSPEVRGDIADYFFEVQRFDRDVGAALKKLEEMGELDNTIVVVTGDHGWPFPRGKGNLYDLGTRVPLAIRWPSKIKAGTVREDFVNLTGIAPTFLTAAGLDVPEEMTGDDLLDVVRRDYVVFGKERHTPAQEAPNMGGTPMRAIRTKDYLYIRNFEPDRWPAGQPDPEKGNIKGQWYADCDNGPTKLFIIENREKMPNFYKISFAKRPEIELYDLQSDSEQLVNVIDVASERLKKMALRAKIILEFELLTHGDPREPYYQRGEFDTFPYYGGGGGMFPGWKKGG